MENDYRVTIGAGSPVTVSACSYQEAVRSALLRQPPRLKRGETATIEVRISRAERSTERTYDIQVSYAMSFSALRRVR